MKDRIWKYSLKNHKKIKDFVRADQIRQDLLDMNIEIKDTQEGTEWSVKQ